MQDGFKNNEFLNIGFEITDGPCRRGLQNKIAFMWQGKTGKKKQFTFDEVRRYSNRVAGALTKLGINKGDRVFVYMERIPELYFCVPGILKSGAVYGPLFSSFGPEALKDRLGDCGARVLFTQAELMPNVEKAAAGLPGLEYIIAVGLKDGRQGLDGKDILPAAFGKGTLTEALKVFDFHELMEESSEEFDTIPTGCEDGAILHYTSGTTGKPKGALHMHRAVEGHSYTARYALGLKDNDIYWCTADPAWVTGTSYGIIGPWISGITQMVCEASYRAADVFDTIQKYGITVWYTAPTLIRMLMREKDDIIRSFNLSTLRHIASVGEALNPEAIKWSGKYIGLPIHDTWFQTETGSIMICNTPGMAIKPGSMGKPLPTVNAGILGENYEVLYSSGSHSRGDKADYDASGAEAPAGYISGDSAAGRLAIRAGWPSMFAIYWGRQEAYEKCFKGGWYVTGDRARVDEDGYFWFIAREDDVINTAGHLVSPFEVESVLLQHPAVAESAVIGLPDYVLGEKVKAFIRLKEGYDITPQLKIELRMLVRNQSSPFAVPQDMAFIDSIPRTRSGKLMRRLLKARELGLPEGDISTVDEE